MLWFLIPLTTTKYNSICVSFVVVNHHRQNVMFGCALLFDETSVSFNRLFKVFLESSRNKQPKTIFTDQDAAMATSHRLCLWNISKNAPSHLSNLNSDNKFKSLFRKCTTME